MLGEWNECYMPAGELVVKSPGHNNPREYRRSLDLDRGIVTVNYSVDHIEYKRETFASHPDKAIVIRYSPKSAGKLNLSASLSSLLRNEITIEGNQLVLRGNAPKHAYPHYLGKMDPVFEEGKGMRFQIRVLVRNRGGNISAANGEIQVNNADEVEFLLTAATSFNGFDKDPVSEGRDEELICIGNIASLTGKNWDELREAHIADYSSFFSRVSLDLGKDEKNILPVNERISGYKIDSDPALTSLYYQFGRYLLISSSRPGKFAQPANLQGIWSRSLQPAWSANWTLNCNAQINYWSVESANLSECHLPLIEMTRELSVDGALTARNLYGAGGWVAHHNADIWRTTSPVGGSGLWAIYQVGSAWLCHHIWQHYEFTLDRAFLEEMYPVMKGAARFYIDNLQVDKDGFYVTNPSESFENTFRQPNGTTGWACVGATQDMQIIRDLFTNTLAAGKILKKEEEFSDTMVQYLEKLLPMRISPTTGRLQEWKDDWEAENPFNAQVAHGWGLAAGNQISPIETPELAGAFRKTIEYRKPWEAYNAGSWVGSFPAMYWARLHNGNMLQTVIDRHIQNAISPNLTSHFQGYWEIDGNLGITASISEMLLQSHTSEIILLPALPDKYPNGSVKGLRARGGYEVDISWQSGKLTQATIRSGQGGDVKLRYHDRIIQFTIPGNSKRTIKISDYE